MIPIPEFCHNSYDVPHKIPTIFLPVSIAIEIPFSWFSMYCITKLTPRNLFLSKILLLVHQFWVTFYSFVICVGLLPVAFFPYMAFYSRGIFDWLEWGVEAIIYLIGTGFAGMLFSVMLLFAYRHQSILPAHHFLKIKNETFWIFFIFIQLLTFLFIIPFVLTTPDQEISLNTLRSTFSNPPCDLWHPRIIIFWFGIIKQVIFYLIFLLFCSLLMVVFVLHSFHIMRVYRNITSKNTRKRQIGFLYALTLMATIPNVFLFSPTVILVFSSIGSYSYNSVLGDTMVCFVGLHGFLSTLTLILSHKLYRVELMFLLNKAVFWKKQTKKLNTVFCDPLTRTSRF